MSKPGFYDLGGQRERSPKDQMPLRPSTSPPCQPGAEFKRDWHRPKPETLREGGCTRSRIAGSQGRSPTTSLPPPTSDPRGTVCKLATHGFGPQMCFVWPTAVFVKNMIELPTFKKQVISYQNLHISACWKTSLKSQEIWQHWAHVPTQELLLGAVQQPTLYTGLGARALPVSGRRGSQRPGLHSWTARTHSSMSSPLVWPWASER